MVSGSEVAFQSGRIINEHMLIAEMYHAISDRDAGGLSLWVKPELYF